MEYNRHLNNQRRSIEELHLGTCTCSYMIQMTFHNLFFFYFSICFRNICIIFPVCWLKRLILLSSNLASASSTHVAFFSFIFYPEFLWFPRRCWFYVPLGTPLFSIYSFLFQCFSHLPDRFYSMVTVWRPFFKCSFFFTKDDGRVIHSTCPPRFFLVTQQSRNNSSAVWS